MSSLPPSSHPALRRARLLGMAALALLFAGAGVRLYVNHAQARALEDTTRQNAIRTVQVTRPKPARQEPGVALPGTLRAQAEAAIHARTSGYLQRWTKDIGDAVAKGELLAVIEAPEVDQDLAQARAQREQIKARLALTQSSLARWEGLRQRDAVSQQEVDERQAAHRQAVADLAAADATVKRLEQQQGFQRVTAPFSGVVVRRGAEVGSLVAAGNPSGAAELYYLAKTDPLRLTVAVPQAYAAGVRPGQEVDVRLVDGTGASFKGRVARTARAIDVATRSMQVEVEVPNRDGALLPGAYAEAVFAPQAQRRTVLTVPAQALQFRQDGPRVAVVTAEGTIALRNVRLGRDLGRSVEVVSGLAPDDRVVLNPHDAIEEQEKVTALEAQDEPEGKAGKRAS